MSQVSFPDMTEILVPTIAGFFTLVGILLSNRRKNNAEHKVTDDKLDQVIAQVHEVRLTTLETREDARDARAEFSSMKEDNRRAFDVVHNRLDRLEHS